MEWIDGSGRKAGQGIDFTCLIICSSVLRLARLTGDASEMFWNVPSPRSDTGNYDYYSRELRTSEEAAFIDNRITQLHQAFLLDMDRLPTESLFREPEAVSSIMTKDPVSYQADLASSSQVRHVDYLDPKEAAPWPHPDLNNQTIAFDADRLNETTTLNYRFLSLDDGPATPTSPQDMPSGLGLEDEISRQTCDHSQKNDKLDLRTTKDQLSKVPQEDLVVTLDQLAHSNFDSRASLHPIAPILKPKMSCLDFDTDRLAILQRLVCHLTSRQANSALNPELTIKPLRQIPSTSHTLQVIAQEQAYSESDNGQLCRACDATAIVLKDSPIDARRSPICSREQETPMAAKIVPIDTTCTQSPYPAKISENTGLTETMCLAQTQAKFDAVLASGYGAVNSTFGKPKGLENFASSKPNDDLTHFNVGLCSVELSREDALCPGLKQPFIANDDAVNTWACKGPSKSALTQEVSRQPFDI
ncbi:unnamed protein product [Protopolystoma xenopodis]|uniref:Uncharacterized protein n=1 Tax=Protopolystoma xenopodis TaxID=117903 RepID=A0A3S5AW45_9PLAT|nr:unnamed protein product [Protopolystoma xenopodis]